MSALAVWIEKMGKAPPPSIDDGIEGVETPVWVSDMQHVASLTFQMLFGREVRHCDYEIVATAADADNITSVSGLKERFVPELAYYLWNHLPDPDAVSMEEFKQAIGLIADHVLAMSPNEREEQYVMINDQLPDRAKMEQEIAALAERCGISVDDWQRQVGFKDLFASEDEEDDRPKRPKERRLPDRYEVRVDGVKVEGSSRIDHATRKYETVVKNRGERGDCTLYDLNTEQELRRG